MHNLGWIGLGSMGTPMAANFLESGYKISVYNRTSEKMMQLVKAGAKSFKNPQEVTEDAEIVFLMLSNAVAVEQVLSAEDGVLKGLSRGKIIVDMSTVSPQASVRFAGMVEARGGAYLDAPVSGSVVAARDRQLVILAGGKREIYDSCQPYLNLLGKKTIYFGDQGKGSAAKLSVNLLLGIIGQGFAETLTLAESLGLDKKQVLEMIAQSPMNCGLFDIKRKLYEEDKFPSAFALDLMVKDLGLIKDELENRQIKLPLAEAAEDTYREAQKSGRGAQDMAAVYSFLKEKNECSV